MRDHDLAILHGRVDELDRHIAELQSRRAGVIDAIDLLRKAPPSPGAELVAPLRRTRQPRKPGESPIAVCDAIHERLEPPKAKPRPKPKASRPATKASKAKPPAAAEPSQPPPDTVRAAILAILREDRANTRTAPELRRLIGDRAGTVENVRMAAKRLVRDGLVIMPDRGLYQAAPEAAA